MRFAVFMNLEKVYDRIRRALRYLLRVIMLDVIGRMMGKSKAFSKGQKHVGGEDVVLSSVTVMGMRHQSG